MTDSKPLSATSMGGGTIRAATKVAGIAAATGGLRGIAAEHFPVSSAARKAASACPSAATTEDVKLVASKLGAGVQRLCLGIDDWVFAGGEGDEVLSAAEPMPRVVFGGAPSLQEAKEATSELTVALEKAYLSSPNSVEGSVVADNDSSLSLSNKQVVENKACNAIAPAVPAPAIMAFRFLRESSAAQNVVASIASDPNVWNAVLQNTELQDFLQSQRACKNSYLNLPFFSDENLKMELVADSDMLDQSSAKIIDDSSEYAKSEPSNGFMDILQKIKSTVVDMMSNLSDYFLNFFGGKGVNGVHINSDGTARSSADTVMEASFMGLAVMAILVILLKRA
ncbi:hypothetical protein DH2020_008623 [Rehmannia glutinosa]|uniref:Plant heme peroxidase family profile domain-containing protein n=1 Tax=Rehmannia glutinosa TaxID=99300 RepID=A0ABR0X7E6_REHGL